MKWICLLSIFLLSCSSKNNFNPLGSSSSTYIEHQFKDKLTIAQITDRISTYIPNASSFLHPLYDVTVYRVTYQTHDHKGNELQASGMVYIPNIQYAFLPIISYQHGTAIRRTEVPSITGDLDYYVPFMLASESGAIVCEADYIGLGYSQGVHHYFDPEEESNAVIDLLRSVQTLLDKTLLPLGITKDVLLAGYSQGGHATLAAQRDIETKYSREFNLKASAPMASFFSFENSSQFKILKDSIAYPEPAVYADLINSINTTEQVYSMLNAVFIPPYDSITAVVFDGNHDADSVNALYPAYFYNCLQPSFRNAMQNDPNNAFIKAASNYDLLSGWTPQAPTHFYHSESDELVFYDNSVIAYQTFLQRGGNVQLVSLGHLSHLDANLLALQKLRDWFYPLVRIIPYR